MFILPLTNFHISVEAPKNVPEKLDHWIQKYHQLSHDIASSGREISF